eukprot:GHVL01008384.1.p1 GENE.GHVL01008384.1~~GHVL01008384.1.p1  ORF type:complete len:217 (-),score=58.31 GHVL01008384.1:144-794(-)
MPFSPEIMELNESLIPRIRAVAPGVIRDIRFIENLSSSLMIFAVLTLRGTETYLYIYWIDSFVLNFEKNGLAYPWGVIICEGSCISIEAPPTTNNRFLIIGESDFAEIVVPDIQSSPKIYRLSKEEFIKDIYSFATPPRGSFENQIGSDWPEFEFNPSCQSRGNDTYYTPPELKELEYLDSSKMNTVIQLRSALAVSTVSITVLSLSLGFLSFFKK